MTTQNIGLMKALAAKMDYLDHRQRILAQNVANADTPGYLAHDLTAVDFSGILKNVAGGAEVQPATTNARHLPAPGQVPDGKDREKKPEYEIAPAENAVILEDQMLKVSRNAMDYQLMTSLYQKNVNMIRTALGRGQ
ncbi:MAG: flagellar basal body rod protein FlgB [Alphaproteobacteria bacterium]|nr:flagellar basal body rod protein FlgB [Alphaproteobacteria bacterium]